MNEIRTLKIDDLTKQLVRFSRLSYRRGLVGATGGNLSVRVKKNTFLITPSGVSLRDISSNNLIVINQGGIKLEGPKALKPSKEMAIHLCIYKDLPQIGAVVHLHPPYATAFSLKSINLPMITVSSKLKLGGIPVVKCALPGSTELVENIEKTLHEAGSQVKSLMLAAHGLLSFGVSLAEAYDIAELTEETAKVNFISQNIGKGLKDKDL